MPKIFISYRRQDSEDITGRLCDHLVAHFGQHDVFMDVDTLPFGADFRRFLDQAVSRCDVLIAVIGSQWLACRYADGPKQGERRLDDPADFVRIEVQSALARGIPVIPVMVNKAAMPPAQALPEGLKALAYRHAAQVRAGRDFRDDVIKLIQGIESLVRQEASRRTADSKVKPNALPSKRVPRHGTAVRSVRPAGHVAESHVKPADGRQSSSWNRYFFCFTLLGAVWLVATVLWAFWTYWAFFLVGDRYKASGSDDPTPKVWVCVAGAALLAALLAWTILGVRLFRSQGTKRP